MSRVREALAAVRAELRAGPDARSRRGAALLIVLVTLAVLSAFTVEFHYKSYVSVHVASNLRDEVVAYYHARAAMEVARLVIKSQNVADNMLNAVAAFAPQMRNQNVELWTLACEFANAFCTGQLRLMGKTFFDFKGQKGVGVEEGGMCKCRALPEDGRMNVNRVDTLEDKNQMFGELYQAFVQHRDAEEKPRADEIDKEIAEMVLNIVDYADADTQRSDLVGTTVVDSAQPEGASYTHGGKPKDAKLDTLAELQRIPGVDPELYCRAAEELTPYATQLLNVNVAPLPVLRRLLCNHTQNALEACYGLGATSLPIMHYAMFCMDICRTLRQSLLSPGFSNVQDFLGFFDRLPADWQPRPILNKAALQNRIGVKSRVIRVETTGGSFNTFKSLTSVIDTSTGNYVYWREY